MRSSLPSTRRSRQTTRQTEDIAGIDKKVAKGFADIDEKVNKFGEIKGLVEKVLEAVAGSQSSSSGDPVPLLEVKEIEEQPDVAKPEIEEQPVLQEILWVDHTGFTIKEDIESSEAEEETESECESSSRHSDDEYEETRDMLVRKLKALKKNPVSRDEILRVADIELEDFYSMVHEARETDVDQMTVVVDKREEVDEAVTKLDEDHEGEKYEAELDFERAAEQAHEEFERSMQYAREQRDEEIQTSKDKLEEGKSGLKRELEDLKEDGRCMKKAMRSLGWPTL